METCSVVLTFESVDEILWCDHSNKTSQAVLLHGTIIFFFFLYFTGGNLGLLFNFDLWQFWEVRVKSLANRVVHSSGVFDFHYVVSYS